MRKRSWTKILSRIVLAIIGLPIIVIALLIVLLYIPPVQRAVVEKACKEIALRSGYDIGIGSIELIFPLKLRATDFEMSKGDSIYFQGESFDANISLTPLLRGKVEINYISLEDLNVNTRDIIPDIYVDGKVGYARVVVRDADLANAVADIRQLHIADTDLNIVLADTTASEESEPLPWIINLHSGRINNSSINLAMPYDTLNAGIHIERLLLNRGSINLLESSFAAKELALDNSRIEYDRGDDIPEQAPLDHIKLRNININAKDLRYTTINDISADITDFTFEQPDGIAITDAAVHFTSSKESLQLHRLEIASRNGSRISAQSTIPQTAMQAPMDESLSATLVANINKPDLARLVPLSTYQSLDIFDRELLNAEVALSGRIDDISIDTIAVEFPGVGAINANGNIKEILDADGRNANIALNAVVDDITTFTGHSNDSIDGKVNADGIILYGNGEIDADISLHCAEGVIAATANYNIADTAYNANISIENLALVGIMPDIPLHNLTMNIKANGNGIDLFSKEMHYNADIAVDTFHYAGYRLHSINAKASQEDCISLIEIEGNDNKLQFGIDARTELSTAGIDNRTTIDLRSADLKEIGLVDSLLKVSTNIDIAVTSDFKESHSLSVRGDGMDITTRQNRFNPGSLVLDFATSPKRTDIKVQNGDLNVDGNMRCGYNRLFAAIDEIATMNRNMMSGESGLYHLHDYEEVLPRISLKFDCGEKNVLHNFLAFSGIETKSITMDADISPRRGLNIKGDVSKFRTGDIRLDSIRFATRQYKDRLTYIVSASDLTIASPDGENSHNAMLYGSIKCDTITSNFVLRDNVNSIDSKAGLTALISPGNMNIHFNPEALVFGAPFAFNRDNYINIGKAMSVEADVTFTGGNENGFHLYTTPDKNAEYNISLELFNIHLAEIANALPAIPDVGGTLSAKVNYRKGRRGDIFICNANVDTLTYNGNTIGNEKVSIAYSPKTDDIHELGCRISHDNTPVAHIKSDYQRGRFNGDISITRLPLDITQAFIDKEGVIIDGYLNSKINFSGTLSQMKSHGYMQLDSTYAYSPMLGATLHPSDDMIMIENNNVNLQKYHIYDKANTPFVINGKIDITNLLNPRLGLLLNATNYEILNAPQKAGNMVYGKMYVDLRSMIRGTLDDIRMMGDLTILSNSNFAYVIPETAFDSSKDLDGLVEFVNFNDTTSVAQQEPAEIDLGDITANLNIIIEQGAKMSLDFDSSRENYVSIEGDGNLNATYDSKNGFGVTGIYNLNGGQVKLTLPIIPLKTFYIQEGGRLTWTGDLFNPTLDVTAMEKTTAMVEMDDNSIQPVVFNAGVAVKNTINDLAVDFTMSSPENSVIQNQLNELDKESMNRYAVAMIIAGTYLGGRQGVTAASALSSFLDAKINQISGNAIKNFDVNIGINDALNAETGNAYTNYSFSFSKRFLNDRITIVIGGEVNSGDRPDKNAGNNTFINNISLEWKLNDGGNRYIRIFYDKNYQSLLEGEIIETGVGYVYKRKLNKLKELFVFKRKDKKNKENPVETDKIRAKQ